MSRKTKEMSQENEQKKSVKAPEFDMLKKIAMLNNLASACEDEKLMEAFGSLKNGQLLFEIFVKAVNKEIQGIVNGKETEIAKSVSGAKEISNSLFDQVQTMYNMMVAISGSPIMKVMALTHDRLTGTSIADILHRQSMAQVNVNKPASREEMEIAESVVTQSEETVGNVEEPQQGIPSRAKPPLTKKYADGRSDVQPAPAIPPRGGNISGLF